MVLHITPWDRDLLEQLAHGVATKEIAVRQGMNIAELESRLARLFGKLGAGTTTEAVAAAMRRGLVAA